jgi:replicative DNA helicase
MMTRAQRYMQLYAQQTLTRRLQQIATERLDNVYTAASRQPGMLPTQASERTLEMQELRRQMGFTDKRELAVLMKAWEDPGETKHAQENTHQGSQGRGKAV